MKRAVQLALPFAGVFTKCMQRRAAAACSPSHAKGFTLLETIVTIVALAFVGMMGAMAVSSTTAQLFTARNNLNDRLAVRTCMERAQAEFVNLLVDYENCSAGEATCALETKLASDLCQNVDVNVEYRSLSIGTSSAELVPGQDLLLVTISKGTARLFHVFGD